MKPTTLEIEAAFKEESEAVIEFTKAQTLRERGELKFKAARGRLMLARSQKSALVRDMMSYT
jgi:hypothetical protein